MAAAVAMATTMVVTIIAAKKRMMAILQAAAVQAAVALAIVTLPPATRHMAQMEQARWKHAHRRRCKQTAHLHLLKVLLSLHGSLAALVALQEHLVGSGGQCLIAVVAAVVAVRLVLRVTMQMPARAVRRQRHLHLRLHGPFAGTRAARLQPATAAVAAGEAHRTTVGSVMAMQLQWQLQALRAQAAASSVPSCSASSPPIPLPLKTAPSTGARLWLRLCTPSSRWPSAPAVEAAELVLRRLMGLTHSQLPLVL